MAHPTITLERLGADDDAQCEIGGYGHDRSAAFQVQGFTAASQTHVGELFVCADHITTAYDRLRNMAGMYA